MTRAWCTLACVGVLAAGCAAPDYKRGKEALEAGDIETAEQNLRPLADLGYDDAKMQLARVYARRTDEESRKEAIALYQELIDKDPAVAVPLAKTLMMDGSHAGLLQAESLLLKAEREGEPLAIVPLLELYSDHPHRDKKRRAPALAQRVARIKTPEAEAAVIKWYRRNAMADARHARELVRLCEPAKDRLTDCYVDLARFYRGTNNRQKLRDLHAAAERRMAAGGLSLPLIERYGWSLVSEDYPGAPWPEAAYPMLREAARTSVVGTVRLARLLMEYPHLDPNARPEQLLLQAGEQGHPEAALALGRLYLDGKLVPSDPAKAERYLRMASATQPAAHFYLGKLYRRGYLGTPDPVRAAQHFLTAARSGYPRADSALAEMFSDNRGVRPNLANAFVFASLAVDERVPESEALLRQIRSSMRASQLAEGRRLLKQELAVRESLPRPDEWDTPTAVPSRAEATP